MSKLDVTSEAISIWWPGGPSQKDLRSRLSTIEAEQAETTAALLQEGTIEVLTLLQAFADHAFGLTESEFYSGSMLDDFILEEASKVLYRRNEFTKAAMISPFRSKSLGEREHSQ